MSQNNTELERRFRREVVIGFAVIGVLGVVLIGSIAFRTRALWWGQATPDRPIAHASPNADLAHRPTPTAATPLPNEDQYGAARAAMLPAPPPVELPIGPSPETRDDRDDSAADWLVAQAWGQQPVADDESPVSTPPASTPPAPVRPSALEKSPSPPDETGQRHAQPATINRGQSLDDQPAPAPIVETGRGFTSRLRPTPQQPAAAPAFSQPQPAVMQTGGAAPFRASSAPVGQAPLRQAPAGHAPSAGQPAAQYKVRPNDTMYSISQQFYGVGDFYQALARHNLNRCPTPQSLRIGQTIEIPSVAALRDRFPALCPKARNIPGGAVVRQVSGRPLPGSTVYRVQRGDTLFDIAKYELGDATRWVEIFQLNEQRLGDDFDYLPEGMELLIPTDEPPSRDRFAREPDDGTIR